MPTGDKRWRGCFGNAGCRDEQFGCRSASMQKSDGRQLRARAHTHTHTHHHTAHTADTHTRVQCNEPRMRWVKTVEENKENPKPHR
jgi:hypothetical protein